MPPYNPKNASGKTWDVKKGKDPGLQQPWVVWWAGRSSKSAKSGFHNGSAKYQDWGKMWVKAGGQFRSRKVMSWIQEVYKHGRSRSKVRILLPLTLMLRTTATATANSLLSCLTLCDPIPGQCLVYSRCSISICCISEWNKKTLEIKDSEKEAG